MALMAFLFLLIYNVLSAEQYHRDQAEVVIENINDFGFDLLKVFNQEERLGEENLFYSPASISLSIAMLSLGSRGNTADQIAKAFKWYAHEFEEIHLALKSLQEAVQESENDNLEMKIANGIWGHQELHEAGEFKESTMEFYNTSLAKVDFKEGPERARDEINNWVERNTAGKVKNFLPSNAINRDTRLALINAVYFQGTWLHAFQPERSYQALFYTSSDLDNVIEVEMMSRKSKHNYFADKEHDCQIIELPYSGNDISMFIALPGEINGLSRLENIITSKIFSMWLISLENTTVTLSIPKFKLNQQFELKEALNKLGITDIFEPGTADLSGISSVESLYVSHVMHKAYVDVHEQGTEAAAVTGILMQKRSIDPHPEVYANHPFLFIIYHKSSGAVLFIGRVKRPTVKEREHMNGVHDFGHQSIEL
ncbi:leukocyte elastase inhibitor-like [Acropora millepora]|uniref:leukocyte elastase inhibitor-like n=1 Tax=Acropora millepora TaxID=45264 RepID=UPI001CF581B3|nr:leukocyte elastase inhibitor-like [Acropora millepora]